jgi:hypothetical protein
MSNETIVLGKIVLAIVAMSAVGLANELEERRGNNRRISLRRLW